MNSISLLLFIGLFGFVLVSRKFIPATLLAHLSSLVLEVALPSMVFVKLINGFDPDLFIKKLLFPFYWIIFTIVIFILTFIFSYISKVKSRQEFRISLFFQIGIFIPIIMITDMFGTNYSHLVELFLFTMLYPAFFFNTYHLFFKGNNQKINWKKILHPVLLTTLLAIIIKLFQMDSFIPSFIIKGLSLVGSMTIPLLMIVLGGTIYLDFKGKGKIEVVEVLKFILIKNFIYPLIILSILYYANFDYNIALLIIIQSAVPPLTALPIITDRAGGNRSLVNQFLVASFISSIISMPLIMMLFEKIVRK